LRANLEEDVVSITENPDSIRGKIGKDFDLKKFFSPEKIQKAQHIINDIYTVFYEDIIKLVTEAEASYHLAELQPREAEKSIAHIAEYAFLIKGKSETIGSDMGFMIANSLYGYAFGLSAPDSRKLLVIRKHLDFLSSNFINKTQNMPAPNVVMESLNLLIEKIGR